MDNLRRALPIRKYQLQKPLVIAFNMHLSHYNAYGTKHYDRLKKLLTSANDANLSADSVYLLPNVTNMTSSIDSRGQSLAKSLSRLLDRIGVKQCHLAAHSFTGVDARAAISMYGLSERVESLTTVCSPHHGMKLIDNCLAEGHKHA